MFDISSRNVSRLRRRDDEAFRDAGANISEANAIRISAEAEKTAAQLRGQGVALFREEVAMGMSKAAAEMKSAGLDYSVILFSMWTDSIKHFAENGRGNVIFLDGSSEAMGRTMKEMMALSVGSTFMPEPPPAA